MRILPQRQKKPDYIFALTIFALLFFGIIMISSSSIVLAEEYHNNNYHYVVRQIISVVIGLILMFVTYNIDYRFWRKISFFMILATLIMLILVLVPGIGKEIGGAHRWFGFGTYLFQPSELVKLTFIIYLASWLEKKSEAIKDLWTGFMPFIILLIIIGLLIMLQPDLGTMSVIAGMAATVVFIAGARWPHMLSALAAAVVALGILIKAAPYRMQRLLVFLNPGADVQGAGYHINQSLIAIGSGGLWGLGFGKSRQKYLYLPQAHTDSIFAIIAEELGFIRTSLFLALILFLGYRGLRIAKNAPDMFSRLLSTGIISWIMIQTFINIAAMLNLVPLTGVPMPFISYGGSSVIILLAAAGIVLNISKHAGEGV